MHGFNEAAASNAAEIKNQCPPNFGGRSSFNEAAASNAAEISICLTYYHSISLLQ